MTLTRQRATGFDRLSKKEETRSLWLDKLGIDKTCRLVALCRGMIALTAEPDGTHTLWNMGYVIDRGDATTMRARYALFVPDWLQRFYV